MRYYDTGRKKILVKRLGYTDRWYIYNVKFVSIVVTVSFITILLSGVLNIVDLSPVGVIVSSAFAELSIHTGFIIWKAKNENMSKFNKDDVSNREEI